MKQTGKRARGAEAGFSLLELLVAMGVTLVIMALASSLVSQAFNVRRREDMRTTAIADAQRALNIITREIGNAGYGLASNGIYAAQSASDSITLLSDFDEDNAWDEDEIVSFQLRANAATGSNSLVRLASGAAGTPNATGTVLAESVNTLRVRYFSQRRNYTTADCDLDAASVAAVTTPDKAQYVVLVVCAALPAVGTPGTDGYQPASNVQFVSDATLRNSLTRTNTALPKY